MKPRREPAPAGLNVDPVRLAEELSKLPPNDQLVVAARVGVEMSQMRRDHGTAMRDAAKDVSAAGAWRGFADRHVPHEELQRRRAEPSIPQQRAASTAEMVARARSACREAETPREAPAVEEPPADGHARVRV